MTESARTKLSVIRSERGVIKINRKGATRKRRRSLVEEGEQWNVEGGCQKLWQAALKGQGRAERDCGAAERRRRINK